ncbi:MAG: hypothetical protein COA84_13090 [Robiginitomaculum sp.]|nr:MAG: hypothetical protein COA84_13090 [Robiginitomaculum sp.]
MATTFQNHILNAQRKGHVDQQAKSSINWFRLNVRKTTNSISTGRLFKEEQAQLVNSWTSVGPGQMYFVNYDPKHKKTLPYYDSFPLIIPIERYKDGILAMNLHYLPPVLRAKLLDALFDTVNNKRFDEKTKMKVSYDILSGASKFSLFQPCIKRYLGPHFRSRFIRIKPESWTPAVFLPFERFEKASNAKVWADSRKMMRGKR